MGDTIILSVAQSILKKISSFSGDLVLSSITDVIKAAKSAKHDLKIIADKMNAICAVLEDAENKQYESKSIDVWLRDLKDIVYDIDDLLNEVAYDVLQRKANEGHFGRQLRYYLSSSSPLVSRFVLSHKIKDLRIKLENIVAKKNDFELTKCEVEITRDQIRDPFDVCDFVYESDILGREDAKQFIKSKLLTATNTNVLSVLPIVGMGGIGKTALAKYVYRDVDVVQHFDLMLWACVSDEFDISKIIGDILSNATTSKGKGKGKGKQNTSEESASNQHLGILVNKLSDLLAGKKYFLVLDDVWVENHQDWKNLMNILDNQIGGSVILITTRDHKVASLIETIDRYNLNRLADSVCWSIFKQLAFKDGEEEMYPNLVQIGMSIVEKCGGIPLVVRCLGSMLKIERDEHEWRRIANLESFATIHGQYDKVLQLLNLSYIKLPRHLKRCFAYLSLFNKDVNLVAGEVSILWSALGVLPLEDEKLDVLDRGYNYFMELISRSFVQDTECYAGVLTGKVHDLLHDLAVNILKEALCVVTWDKLEVSEFVRHIVWGYETPNTLSNKEFPKKLMKAKKLRTFQFNYNMEYISQSFLKGIISNFKYIRVLDLSKSLFTELPRSIGDLIHLRYLDLSYNVIIKSLPNTIKKLLNLETLYMDGCENLQDLNRYIHHIQNLKHLTLTTCQKSLISSTLNKLSSIELLGIWECKSLEHLWDNDNIGNLVSIKTLLIIDCPKLSSLPNSMKFINGLDSLLVNGCEELDMEEGEAMEGLEKLRRFAIAKMPKLRYLPHGIQHATNHLQFLFLENLDRLVELPEWLKYFVILQEIHIYECPNLLGLPNAFVHLKTLRKLEIQDCPHLSKKCVVPIGEDYHLIRHVSKFELDGICYTPN